MKNKITQTQSEAESIISFVLGPLQEIRKENHLAQKEKLNTMYIQYTSISGLSGRECL